MKKITIIISIIFVIFLIIKFAVFNNVDFLCIIAGGLDQPSNLHNFFMDRIYKIADKKDVGQKLIEHLKKGRHQSLHNLYMRILAVIGEAKSLTFFMEFYIKHQDEQKSWKLLHIIDCIGLLGKEKTIRFLEVILNKEDQWGVLNCKIAHSLYLLRGKQYDFIDWNGDVQKFYPLDDSKRAREIILTTKNRKRSYKEMIILDKLFRRDR